VLTLTLVRHGQTEFNAESRLQGWCDSPLTPGGLARVRVTATHLATHPFEAAYASPSGRAQTTAREILAHHPAVPMTTVAALREFGFGEFEARPEAELEAEHDPQTLYPEVLAGTFPGLPGGERGQEFLARVRSAFERIERRHQQGHVLVVSHGLTLRAYLRMIDARPMTQLPNASVSVVEVLADGRRRVAVVGDSPATLGRAEFAGRVPAPVLAG
jgi:probable phosphoglycerate mutase